MRPDKDITYALSLSGGGYKGAYQAGILRALHEEGFRFGAVCGTSIGALNGILVMQEEFDKLKDMWCVDCKDVFHLDNEDLENFLKLNLSKVNILELGKGIFDLSKKKGVDVAPLKEMIEAHTDEALLRKKDAKFGLVTINLTDKRGEELMLEDMPEGRLTDYLLATAYLPFLQKIKLNGKYYLDGGYYNNTPTNMLVERGYQDIIEIRLNDKEKIKRYKANVLSIIPSEDLGSSILHDDETILYNYNLGYFDGLRLAKDCLGYQYVIESDKKEVFFINRFLELDAHVILEFETGTARYESTERAILSAFSAGLAKRLGLKKNFSYERLYISILEYAANALGLERFKLYTLESFEATLREQFQREPQDDLLVKLAIRLIS